MVSHVRRFRDLRGTPGTVSGATLACVAALLCAATLAVALLSPGLARATNANANGFGAGPRITPAGLVWRGLGSDMLTTAAGSTRRLPGAGAYTVTSAGSDWLAVAGAGGVEAGRLGGRLTPVESLRGCRPVSPNSEESASPPTSDEPALLALAGSTLYVVVDPACLHRHAGKRLALVAVSLPSAVRRTVTTIAPAVVGLAAAGARVAVSYAAAPAETGRLGSVTRITVAVIGARRGRTLYRITAPVRGWRVAGALTTEIDAQGDVLVTSIFFGPPPTGALSSGWWASPADHAARELPELRATGGVVSSAPRGPETIRGAAALSDGRIAYVTESRAEGEQLELLDLRTGRKRPVADFTGEGHIVGLDLSADELAWAQESTAREVINGPGFESCQTIALGPVQLARMDLKDLPATPLAIGAPVPKIYQKPCIES